MSDDPSAREEGFYWVVLGQNPPEIAYWEAASGGSPVTPGRGSPTRSTCSATSWCSGRG
jgi:hypothetical protein